MDNNGFNLLILLDFNGIRANVLLGMQLALALEIILKIQEHSVICMKIKRHK